MTDTTHGDEWRRALARNRVRPKVWRVGEEWSAETLIVGDVVILGEDEPMVVTAICLVEQDGDKVIEQLHLKPVPIGYEPA
jgi:hypothetical protein